MGGPVALVDCNNFYASCERHFQPRLRGKPVVVLSNNDGFCNRASAVKRCRATAFAGRSAEDLRWAAVECESEYSEGCVIAMNG